MRLVGRQRLGFALPGGGRQRRDGPSIEGSLQQT
jgi:hypothetical protein